MKSITVEFENVRSRMRGKSAAEFFGDRNNKSDWEWNLLGKALNLLREAGEEIPVYAEKRLAPDFLTFREDRSPFVGIEVTEVLRPGYLRNWFHQNEEKLGRAYREIPPPHPSPWSSFYQTLRKKFGRSYGNGAWLLIYLDMGRSDFHAIDSLEFDQPWEKMVTEELVLCPRSGSDSVDLKKSPFDRILMMSADCSGLMEIAPVIRVLKRSRSVFDDDEGAGHTS